MSRWPGRAIEALMDYGPWLPLNVCARHPRRSVRMFGLAWYVVWFLPSMLVILVPMVTMMMAVMVVGVWHGDE